MVGWLLIVLQLNLPLKNFSLTITDEYMQMQIIYIELNLIKDKKNQRKEQPAPNLNATETVSLILKKKSPDILC